MKKPPSSSIGTIPEEGIAIASLEHGGWKRYDMSASSDTSGTLSTACMNIIDLMKCFSDMLRMQIVLLLEQTPQGAGELAKHLKSKGLGSVSQPGVSHHLDLLRRYGMASSVRIGKSMPHTLSQQCHSFLGIIRSIRSPKEADDLTIVTTMAEFVMEPTRVQILRILEGGSSNVSAMCDTLDQSQPAVSHHLAKLLKKEVLAMEKHGKCNIYSLKDRARSYLRAIAELEALVQG